MNEKELIFKIASSICDKATLEFARKNPNVRFCLYQSREGQVFSPYDIVRFYNKNWTGNIDFMHVPNYEKTIRNIINYPIIMAYDVKNQKILGISTLQYNKNTNEVDPYFPYTNTEYFSMTGILVDAGNKEKGLRGIGNKIYQIELLTALYFKNRNHPNTRITCVIDCRNIHSIFALMKAAENMGKEFKLDEKNMEFPAIMDAYYYIKDQNGYLTEAPTLVMEVDLEPQKVKPTNFKKLEFKQTEGDINISLLNTIEKTLKEDYSKKSVINEDQELGGVNVIYVPLDRKENYLKDYPMIITNGTEKGKDRVPLTEEELINLFNGYGTSMIKTIKKKEWR